MSNVRVIAMHGIIFRELSHGNRWKLFTILCKSISWDLPTTHHINKSPYVVNSQCGMISNIHGNMCICAYYSTRLFFLTFGWLYDANLDSKETLFVYCVGVL